MSHHSSAVQQEAITLSDHSAGDSNAASPRVTVFRCAGSSRSPEGEPLASQPPWPLPVHEVVIPCAGRLQPEHLLKAFEAGADVVCVITCAADGCHYLEGGQRAERRAEYVRRLLDEIGLGGNRLLIFDLAASGRNGAQRRNGQESPAQLSDLIVAELDTLESNPLRQEKAGV